MSGVGLPMPMPGAQDPQQQQSPLFGQPVVDPNILKLREALAQQMMMQGQQTQPIQSWTQVADRALSPLAGALMQKHIAQQQAQLQAAASAELPGILSSDDPLKAMAASHNPLVQQMLAGALPDYLKGSFETRNAITKATALGPINTKNAVDLATQTEPIEAKKAVDIAKGTSAVDVAKAIAVAKGTLPFDLEKARAGQAVGFADLAEKKREFEKTQGGSGGAIPGAFGENPASLYGKQP